MAGLRRRANRRGLAMVDAALVFPLVLLLLLGLLEYGWMFLRAQEVTHAARHGARIGARADSTNEDIRQAVAEWMAQVEVDEGGYDVEISPDVALLEPGETLTVTVTVSYEDNLELVGAPLLPVPENLQAAFSMAKEGP